MRCICATLFSIGMLAANVASAADTVAYYEFTFNATWSQLTHPHPDGPDAFPDDPRFSPLVGAIHNAEVTYWAEGVPASPPIEKIAEDGNPGPFLQQLWDDINAHNALGHLYALGAADGRMPTPGRLSIARIRVTNGFPLITLLTMLGPSPDWIVGVSGLSLLDGSGEWYDERVVELFPYDGGSEQGTAYDLENPPTVPPQPITNITGVAPLSHLPLGTFVFRRLPPMASVLSMEWDYAWNTGETGSNTTTLFVDRTFHDSAGGSGSWRYTPSGAFLTLEYEGNDPCGAVQVANLVSATRFEGSLTCSRLPIRTGIASGDLVRANTGP